ncbi:hypothetical protein BU15DRAFT_83588 [Melanogaster broomeanus]|nr:hypothetical protein BU15DRAFT_83588 [Melanogaster broomeanus]
MPSMKFLTHFARSLASFALVMGRRARWYSPSSISVYGMAGILATATENLSTNTAEKEVPLKEEETNHLSR